MDQGILGSIAKYDDLTFRDSLRQGFDFGSIEAAAQQDLASSAEIAQLNAEYGENGLKIVVPTCGPETVQKLEKALTARLQAFRQSETLHALSHASYFLLGSAVGLFYGNSLNELVSDRIGDINAFYPDAKVREDALFEAIKQLPRKNQTAKKFLRSLKQTLQSCHSRVTILFLAACPDNAVKIRSDKEHRVIEETLQRSTLSETYQLHDVKSCRLRDVTAALRKWKPSILHFSGHASKDGLVFENEIGGFDVVETAKLASIMAQGAKHGLRTVVLNACSTAEQSDCIANTVGCVIAMKDAVDDASSIDFMRAFYNSLAEGQGVDDAFKWGLAESQFLYSPLKIRPLLIKGGTKAKAADMERPVTKTRSQMLAIGQLEANSTRFPGEADKDGDAGVTGLAVDEDLTENTEDEDDSIPTSGIENLGLEEPDNTGPLSNSRGSVPSAVSTTVHAKAASAPVPPEGDSGLVATSRPTDDAGSCSIPYRSESVVDEEPKTTVTTTTKGSSPSAEDRLTNTSAESSQGLSMLEQLRIISQTSQQNKEGTHKGAPPSTSGKQQAASSPRPAENGPSPRVASTQAQAPLRTPKPETGGRGGATRSAGAGTQRFFHQHPLLDDPFFGRSSLGGSILNDPFFADFFGPRRSAPARAPPTPGQNSNLNVIGEDGQKLQIPP
ncbi:MAG: hypothetical protein LQ341_006172, partial [Variospora aurantia]